MALSPSVDATSTAPSKHCLERLHREVRAVTRHPIPGVLVEPDQRDLCLLHALVVGPDETPYAGGFFLFDLRFPPDYPAAAPAVAHLNTDCGRVAFSPCLASSGAICPTQFGAWPANAWNPKLTLHSLLLTLLSMFSAEPLREAADDVDVDLVGKYNVYIAHETLRVAVCNLLEPEDMVSYDPIPKSFYRAMEELFKEKFEHYMGVCIRHMEGDTNLSSTLPQLKGFLAPTYRYVEPFPELLRRLHGIQAVILTSTIESGPDAGPHQPWLRKWERHVRQLKEKRRQEEAERLRYASLSTEMTLFKL